VGILTPVDNELVFISEPSEPINILAIAGPELIHSHFRYKYYVPDESINDSGYVQLDTNDIELQARGSGMFSLKTTGVDMEDLRYRIGRQIPRFVDITIETDSPAVLAQNDYTPTQMTERIGQLGLNDSSALIEANLATAHDDSAVSASSPTKLFVSISLQDSDLAWETGREILFTNDLRMSTDDSITRSLANLGGVYSENIIPVEVYESWWANAKNMLGDDVAYSTGGRLEAGSTPQEDTAAHVFQAQINQLRYGDLILRGTTNAVSPFSHDFASDVGLAITMQRAATSEDGFTGPESWNVPIAPITQAGFAGISDAELEELTAGGEATFEQNDIIPLGYVVDKYETYGDGTRFQHRPIVLGNIIQKTVIDTAVAVGRTYSYQVRAAYLIRLTVSDDDGDEFKITALFLSKPTASTKCVCNPPPTPPDPPGDIKFAYDYEDNNLAIHWAFPISSQRDVRYFQIYRRSSFLEPFQLIREYDFNDRVERYDRGTLRRIDLIERQISDNRPNPKTYYIDNEFGMDSKFIYTLVAVDAHENSSNYSIQFKVYFDRFTNNIIVEDVSPSGAPRDYPNYYLSPIIDGVRYDTVLTEDAIKVSQHKEFEVYLDPAAMKIFKPGEGSEAAMIDTHHVVFASGQAPDPADTNMVGKYVMQIINVDNARTSGLEIRINDKRESLYAGGPNPYATVDTGADIPRDDQGDMIGGFVI